MTPDELHDERVPILPPEGSMARALQDLGDELDRRLTESRLWPVVCALARVTERVEARWPWRRRRRAQ